MDLPRSIDIDKTKKPSDILRIENNQWNETAPSIVGQRIRILDFSTLWSADRQ